MSYLAGAPLAQPPERCWRRLLPLPKYPVFQTIFTLIIPEITCFNHSLVHLVGDLPAETAASPFFSGYPILQGCIWEGESIQDSIQELHRMQRTDVQAEKIDWFSCFSLLSWLVHPGIIPGANFVQEAQFPPYFENLVRIWIKLWGDSVDFLGQAHPFHTV